MSGDPMSEGWFLTSYRRYYRKRWARSIRTGEAKYGRSKFIQLDLHGCSGTRFSLSPPFMYVQLLSTKPSH